MRTVALSPDHAGANVLSKPLSESVIDIPEGSALDGHARQSNCLPANRDVVSKAGDARIADKSTQGREQSMARACKTHSVLTVEHVKAVD